MDVFRRIGTQKKKFKLQFFIGRLKFSSFKAGKIYIVIKRGDKKVKTENKLQMSEDFKVNFNKEILQLEVTLFFDQKENKYQQKPGQMNIVLLDQKQSKILLGVVPFDVAEYANSGQQSTKEKKRLQQTSKKLDGYIQFTVFLKYIGQGSQSSSLDKISDFFFGKPKQQQNKEALKEKDKIKEKDKLNQQKLNKKKNKQQDKQSSEQQNHESKNKKGGLKQKKIVSQLQRQKQQQRTEPKYNKNYVTAGKNNKQKAYLTSDNDDQVSKNNFYFDQPQTDLEQQTFKKIGDKKRSNSMQKPRSVSKGLQTKFNNNKKKDNKQQSGSEGSQNKDEEDIQTSQVEVININPSQKQSKGGNSINNKANSQKNTKQPSEQKYFKPESNKSNQQSIKQPIKQGGRQIDKQKGNTKVTQNQLQKLIQQNQSLKSRLEQSQISNKQLKKQLSLTAKQIQQLKEQVQYYQQQIRQRQNDLLKQRDTILNIQSEKGSVEFYQQQAKKIQKQKNQLLVQNSRLKQKYKQDFKKYEQTLYQQKQKQAQLNEIGRAEIQRLKQQCSSYREKIQKIGKQKDEKSSQYNRQRNELKGLQIESAELKSSLSRLKLKICNKLNDALAKNDQSVIDMLMDLNKDNKD